MGCCNSKVRSPKGVRTEDPTELAEREDQVPNVSSTNKLADHEILRRALEIFIPGYKFCYSTDGTTIGGEYSSILALFVCLFVRN